MAQAAVAERHDGEQTQQADNRYTRRIAQFVSGLTYEKIPAEVRQRIKLLILDSLGCGVYGAIKDHSQIAIKGITAVDNSRNCGLWGTNQRVSAPHAALLNGTFVQGFEVDDIHRKGAMHVGSTTLPAIVALSEVRTGMSGKRFLTAAIAGYEIGPRVGMTMGPNHLGQGWHSGATVGAFAGAAASATALGLSEESTIDAL
ncbi:MAG: MmgE/PrpD family protein, partial [Betaproteobacteria bacterium]|nr:MmgE/PrpD family protein [Betaproteobacteria bacterium]